MKKATLSYQYWCVQLHKTSSHDLSIQLTNTLCIPSTCSTPVALNSEYHEMLSARHSSSSLSFQPSKATFARSHMRAPYLNSSSSQLMDKEAYKYILNHLIRKESFGGWNITYITGHSFYSIRIARCTKKATYTRSFRRSSRVYQQQETHLASYYKQHEISSRQTTSIVTE